MVTPLVVSLLLERVRNAIVGIDWRGISISSPPHIHAQLAWLLGHEDARTHSAVLIPIPTATTLSAHLRTSLKPLYPSNVGFRSSYFRSGHFGLTYTFTRSQIMDSAHVIEENHIVFQDPHPNNISGGFGDIFIGEHITVGRVAVKRLRLSPAAKAEDSIRVSWLVFSASFCPVISH